MNQDEVFEKHLSGLDDDLVDYVVSMITDAEVIDQDLVEQLSELFMSADFAESEDGANSVLKDLFAALQKLSNSHFKFSFEKENAAFYELVENGGGGAVAQEDTTHDGPRLLEKPVVMNEDEPVEEVEEKLGLTQFGRNSQMKVIDRKLTRKEKREAERAEKQQLQSSLETSEALEYNNQISNLNLSSLGITSLERTESNINTIRETLPLFLEGNESCEDVKLTDFDLPSKGGSGSLLTNTSVVFAQNRRYGLVGRNGVGKTTFLEALAQKKIFGLSKRFSSLLVKQEITGDDRSALQWVVNSDTKLNILQKLLENDLIQDEKTLQEVGKKVDSLQANLGKEEARAGSILHGLGFSTEMQNKPTSSLSGGWRMRVSIACGLFISPPCLLLDEPTNHLDIEAVLWLEQFLTSHFDGTVLLVSHDRHFLNAVSTDIVLFQGEKLHSYKGDFMTFAKTQEEARVRRERQYEAQEMKRKHLQEYITKHAQAGENGPKAARQRKSRMKKLERLGMEAAAENQGRKFKASYDGDAEEVETIVEEKKVIINFPAVEEGTGTVVSMDNVSFDYRATEDNPFSGELLLQSIDFFCDQKSRIALLGRNGSGKSTFIKLFMGKLKPVNGWVHAPANTRIGYVAQHHMDVLEMDKTCLEFFLSRFPGNRSLLYENEIRRYLASFGLSGEKLPMQQIRTLSGGQKVRLVLALTLFVKPNFLVLDEPTNHCSIELTNALIEAIKGYRGGLLIVSHDQHLLTSVCEEYYVCEKNTVKRYDGSFFDYKKKILRERDAKS